MASNTQMAHAAVKALLAAEEIRIALNLKYEDVRHLRTLRDAGEMTDEQITQVVLQDLDNEISEMDRLIEQARNAGAG